MPNAEEFVWIRRALARYEQPLLRFALQLVGHAHAADVVQDTSLALCHADRASVEERLAPWLFIVCRNRALDLLRERRRTCPLDDEKSVALESQPTTRIERQQSIDRVQAAMQQLPDKHRQVLFLKCAMTRAYDDPRLAAYALGELDADEQAQFEDMLADERSTRRELEEIGRVAALVERELAGPTGLRLNVHQREQLEGAWQARSAGAGDAGAPGDAPSPFENGSPSPALLEDFARPPSNPGARRRFAKALLAAALLHATAAAALVVFPSTARDFVEEPWGAVAFSVRPSPEAPMLAELGETPPRPKPLIPPTMLDGTDIPPELSVAAKRKGMDGLVVVSFDVLEDGTVADIKRVSGPPELFESAIGAIGSWRFKPALRGGQPVRYSLTRAVAIRLGGP